MAESLRGQVDSIVATPVRILGRRHNVDGRARSEAACTVHFPTGQAPQTAVAVPTLESGMTRGLPRLSCCGSAQPTTWTLVPSRSH